MIIFHRVISLGCLLIGLNAALAEAPLTQQRSSRSMLPIAEMQRAWLGVHVQNVDNAIAESLGLGGTNGALVAQIDDKSPSKEMLKVGDVIRNFDGKSINEARDLPKVLAATRAGTDVELLIVRGRKEQRVTVRLGLLQDANKPASPDSTWDRPLDPIASSQTTLGMEFAILSDELRKRHDIAENLSKGVVVTRVDPSSAAAEQHIEVGNLIEEINGQTVRSPADIASKEQELKNLGKKAALLVVADNHGEKRFAALPLDYQAALPLDYQIATKTEPRREDQEQTPEHLSTPDETKTFYDYISVVFSYIYTAFILVGVLSIIFFVFLLDARLNARGGSRSRSSGEIGSAGDATADSISNQREEWVEIYGIQEGPDNNPHVSFYAVDGGRRVGQMPGTLVGNCGVKIQNVVYQMGYLKSGNMGAFKRRSAAPSSPFH